MKKHLIASMIIISFVFVAIIVVVMGSLLFKSYTYCDIEEPLFCSTPLLGPDGVIVKFGNFANERIYVQDIALSLKDGPECVFLRPEIVNTDTDYYTDITSNNFITFFIDITHPDGDCLMGNMKTGKKYDIVVEITYFLNGEKKVSQGDGRVVMGAELVSPEYDAAFVKK